MSLKPAILYLFLTVLVHSVSAACSGKNDYVLTFDFDWSFQTDLAFPNTDALLAPGFSNVICASHSSNYTMWQPGTVLSKPMVDFISNQEEPFTLEPLEKELENARKNGTVLSSNSTVDRSSSLGVLTVNTTVDSAHSFISCVSQIIPSPAWFIGISSLDMCQGSSFRTTHDLRLLGWWGGQNLAENYGDTKPLREGERPFKVRRRIDFAPFGYGKLVISQRDRSSRPANTGGQDDLTNPARTNGPQIVPAAEAICVDVKRLRHLPRKALLYPTHRHAHVLCDAFNNCATPGHIVVYRDQPMMMKSYCQLEANCERRVMLVNSPKYSRAMRIDTSTESLKFTAFAARFATRTEEGVLSLAVRMGL